MFVGFVTNIRYELLLYCCLCVYQVIAFLFVGLHFGIFVFPNFRLFKVHENTRFLKIMFISISF